MDFKNVKDWLYDASPFKRKSALDWIVPSAIGLGIGAAAGVGIGMLLAPHAGTETRQRLRESAESLREKARGLAEKARGQADRSARELTGSSYGDMNAR